MTSTAFGGKQFDHAYPAGMKSHWWHLARNRIVTRELASRIPRQSRILEIGCGPGIVLDALLHQGWDAWGVDLGTTEPIKSAARRVMYGTQATDLASSFRSSVECLLLLDVIEHIEDVPHFLTDVLSGFPAGKTVFVVVPARQEVWSNYDTYYGHFRRYTPQMLRSELELAGLNVRTFRYFFHSPYLVALLMSGLGMKRSVELSAPKLILAQRAVAAWFQAESAILGKSALPGLSLLAVADR